MPVSLLTPIAADLHIAAGRAGQAIALSGVFAVLTGLGISSATRGIDRRLVLLGLTVLMLVSAVMVALAPNALGATLGGILYDAGGHRGTFAASAVTLVASALLAAKGARDA